MMVGCIIYGEMYNMGGAAVAHCYVLSMNTSSFSKWTSSQAIGRSSGP